MKRRSKGLTTLGTALIVLAGLQTLTLLGYISAPNRPSLPVIPLQIIFTGLFYAIGIGILKLKPWARTGAIVFSILVSLLGFSISIPLLITTESKSLISFMPLIILSAGALFYIYYLTRPRVKEQFK